MPKILKFHNGVESERIHDDDSYYFSLFFFFTFFSLKKMVYTIMFQIP